MFILKAIVPWGILAALLSAVATFFWIRFSRKEEWGQEIREEGNKAHYKKKGTPTMGGVAFTAVFLLLLLFVGKGNVETLLIAICTLGFGAIGFLDDWEKMKKRESEGLTPRQNSCCNLPLRRRFSVSIIFLLRQWRYRRFRFLVGNGDSVCSASRFWHLLW